MLPCISSSPPVRKMKLHLWLNLLFYYLWQYSCSYNKFTFWSFKPKSGGWVNCLSVRSSNLLFALESDFAPVSTPDCQNNLFKRIRYFMEFRRLFKSTFVCSCVCLGCECFWSDVHIERWVWQHPLGVSWMFYDLAMFWQQGGRGGFSAQWLLGEHSIECVLFCSVLGAFHWACLKHWKGVHWREGYFQPSDPKQYLRHTKNMIEEPWKLK